MLVTIPATPTEKGKDLRVLEKAEAKFDDELSDFRKRQYASLAEEAANRIKEL